MKNIKSDILYCNNCHHPFAKGATYCHHCSQKRTDGRVTFGEMMSEFSDAVFNLDSRIFKTIGALFVPGKLTDEYFKGRHKRFVHPLRVFLVMTVALVSAASYSIAESDFMDLRSDLERKQKKLQRYEFLVGLDTLKDQTAEKFNHPKATAALDSLFQEISRGRDLAAKDSTLMLQFGTGLSEIDTEMKIAVEDMLHADMDTIFNNYKIEGTLERFLVSQQIRLRRKGANFGGFLFGNITWMVFVMMPLLALVFKLLYIRRDYYYVEHLIFSFHTHAFAFLLFVAMILFGDYAPGWIIGGGFVWLGIYIYKAMRRVYGQSRWKTFAKYAFVNCFYWVILSLAIGFTFIISFAIF